MRWIHGSAPATPSGYWLEAQAQERRAWEEMGSGDPPYLIRRGAFLNAWIGFWSAALNGGVATNEAGRALEIGGAGLPVVDYLEGYGERHSADPLMHEYVAMFGETGLRPEVVRRNARAEELPYADGYFDVVVMLNVLDHVDDPNRVLAETRRVLRPDAGLLFFSCDTYSSAWLALRTLRVAFSGKRNNDVLHPHHFSNERLLRQIARHYLIHEVRSCFGDPFAGEHRLRPAYPPGSVRNRVKRECRLYVVARPKT